MGFSKPVVEARRAEEMANDSPEHAICGERKRS